MSKDEKLEVEMSYSRIFFSTLYRCCYFFPFDLYIFSSLGPLKIRVFLPYNEKYMFRTRFTGEGGRRSDRGRENGRRMEEV